MTAHRYRNCCRHNCCRLARSCPTFGTKDRTHRRRREQQGLSLRDVAEKTGVSASTLSRIENGTGKPDADNIARLAAWLDMPIERVMHHRSGGAAEPKPVVYYPHESTPEIVEAHLRADRQLTPETAKALSELFRVAYAQFSRPAEKGSRKRGSV